MVWVVLWGGVGGRRIIGNALNSIHFHALGCALGARRWPQNHLKCIEFQPVPWFGSCFGERGWLQNHWNCIKFFYFHVVHGLLSRQTVPVVPIIEIRERTGIQEYRLRISRAYLLGLYVALSRKFKGLTSTGVVPES